MGVTFETSGHGRDGVGEHGPSICLHAELDRATYLAGVKIPDQQMKDLETKRILTRHDFHGEWNYTLHRNRDTPEPKPVTAPLAVTAATDSPTVLPPPRAG